MAKTVVFFGNEKLATGVTTTSPVKQSLVANGYDLHLVDKNLQATATAIRSIKPDIGVLVAYGMILPKSLIDIFPHGIINIHPSLLPEGRGSTPIETAILKGNKKTGVSIMKIVEGMDEGPVAAQKTIELTGKETKQELADTLADIGSTLLIKSLSDIFAGKVVYAPQDNSKATYTRKIMKSDGIIDWNKQAVQIDREIRAYAGWPKSRAIINNIDCIIIKAEAVKDRGVPGETIINRGSLSVGCGTGSLDIKIIQPAGKKPMSANEFIIGYMK